CHLGGGAGARAPSRCADARARRGAAGDGARVGRRSPRPWVLMADADWAAEFARAVSRPDPEIGLTRAALVIARAEYPGLDIAAYLDRVDGLARRASGGTGGSLGQLHRIRECLFEEEGFAGNREDYSDPRNSYLSDVLDRRLGIPITLSLVLIEVGRRL